MSHHDEANIDAGTDAFNIAKLRNMLHEHSVNIMSQMHQDHIRLVQVVNASIDSKLERHLASVKENIATVRADMISQAVDAAKCEFVKMAQELNASMSATVRSEVSGLDRKFSAMFDNDTSAHSNGSQHLSSEDGGSQHVSSSASSAVSSRSHASNGSSGVVSVRPWVCPICKTPLKHEKSFTDHMMLLSSRVHELPVVKTTRGGITKVDKRCLFNIENPSHHEVVSPWNREGLSFWNQAGQFMRELMSRLHPGNTETSPDSSLHYNAVFGFIDDCRNGKFVPEQ